ncbi:cholecystokinin receptor type A-like [Saccostrea echinata]|uniref:cholecystokinin receptor type A-like n=1 Tax=Saccostrea echinata TaxID=191078 RepID=UPI002A811C94|nr:cholecystokinin receptor type A-like [Saccostrea echinata]
MDNGTFISEKLDTWNNLLAKGLIPNNVLLSLYILAGLVGNLTVILIYGVKMKDNKEERYFIPYLATADLCASFVCASYGIALNLMQANFNNTYLCKTWWFLAAFTTFTSILILLIIAVHRYRKICKPLGKQMTMKWKRIALFVGLVIAFLLAIPTTHFYGSVPFSNDEEGIIGLRWSRLKTVSKTGSLIFGGVLLLTAIAIIIALICLYAKIGYTILRHFTFMNTICKKKAFSDSEQPKNIEESHASDDPISCTENETYSIETDNTILSGVCSQTSFETKETSFTTDFTLNRKSNPHKSSVRQRKEKDNRRVVHKFTLMFMLITVIFLICHIPKLIIMLMEARNPNFWEQFSDSLRAGVLFVYRMYIINNITIPFIYAFLDSMFAKEIKKLFKICR